MTGVALKTIHEKTTLCIHILAPALAIFRYDLHPVPFSLVLDRQLDDGRRASSGKPAPHAAPPRYFRGARTRWGDRLGKLEPGYEADLIVLDRDPRGGADRSLAQNNVRAVLVAGAVSN